MIPSGPSQRPSPGEMPDRQTVFVVDDDLPLRTALARLLGSVGLTSETFSMAEEFLRSVDPEPSVDVAETERLAWICSAGSPAAVISCRSSF